MNVPWWLVVLLVIAAVTALVLAKLPRSQGGGDYNFGPLIDAVEAAAVLAVAVIVSLAFLLVVSIWGWW